MRRVLITGATGFIGGHLVQYLTNRDTWQPIAISRPPADLSPAFVSGHADESTSREQWHDLLAGCDYVVHAAARAHVLKETDPAPESLYHRINVQMTENLARAAMDVGVKRFLYMSSVGVHGNSSQEPLSEDSPLAPASLYARSKLHAEQLLMSLSETSDMELCVLRPPLVYGPGVGANFLSLIKAVDRRLPLPLGTIDNCRSFINTFNLVNIIETCLLHPAAANEAFLVADGEDISTPDLLSLIAELLGKRSLVFSVPLPVLNKLATLLGKDDKLEKISASLTVDAGKIERLLQWRSVCSLRDALAQTLLAYRGRGS